MKLILRSVALTCLAILCFDSSLQATNCPGMTLSTQVEVDNFSPCDTVLGDLIIDGLSIKDLSNLDGIQVITGSLIITNTSLKSIDGFNALTEAVSVSVFTNSALKSIAGFSSLGSVLTIVLSGNGSLGVISGFNGLTSMSGSIQIIGNQNLWDISGFSNLLDFSGSLLVLSNSGMEDISGFESLDSILGIVTITTNMDLHTISGFQELRVVLGSFIISVNFDLQSISGFTNLQSAPSFVVTANTSLNQCCGLYPFITRGGIPILGGNAPGCNTVAEITAACDGVLSSCLPNCRDVNAAINAKGNAVIGLSDILTNGDSCSMEGVLVTIENEWGALLYGPAPVAFGNVSFPACQYRDRTLKINVQSAAGACWSYLTFKQSNRPILEGRAKDIYCFDPLVAGGHIHDHPPIATVPCGASYEAEFVADWVVPYDCDANMPFSPVNDTIKVIYREYEAFDKEGNRTSTFDTLTVFRIPPIDLVEVPNAFCAERDSTYCGEGNPGPYILIEERCIPGLSGIDFDGDGSLCDTLYFLEYDDSMQMYVENPLFENYKCGVGIHLDKWDFGGDGCEEQTKYVLDIKYDCLGSMAISCPIMETSPNAFQEIAQGYFRCEFWLIDLDTVPPVVDCKDQHLGLTTVFTGTHECAAHTYVPPVYVEDDWTGVKQVKATIEGIGTTVMIYDVEDSCYVGHTQFKLPHRELPYKVIYEVYDSCHNLGLDSCYIRVKDGTNPVPVVDKGLTVSLSDKKIWVDAESFDEGSWDNCGVNLFLVRRSDWYEACIDLCDSLDTCYVSQHHDTIWQANLEKDKHIDEVEAHYAKTLDWLCNDDIPCGDVIYNAWQYDLMKYATLYCKDHPYDVDAHYFDGLIGEAIQDPEFAYKWKNPSTLFIGSGADGLNSAYYINKDGNITELFNNAMIGGAATDLKNKRIIMSVWNSAGGGFNQLYALPFGGSEPMLLATVSHNIFGLAAHDGRIYGATSGTQLIEIDASDYSTTVLATLSVGGISGIDADPLTGKVYAANDFSLEIGEVNLSTGLFTPMIQYPAGESDIDGLAIGENKIFMVTDEPGEIYVYNLGEEKYEQSILSPFTGFEAQSGGAAYMPMLEDLVDEWSQIGGGWSDQVVFSCDDACGPVTVEILVMDYWCNWAKAWTKVWVEDKTPITIAKDVVEEEHITCKTYKDKRYTYPDELHPVSLDYVVTQAKLGEQDAFDLLDEVFGGYCKAWSDPYGNYVDIYGNEIECDITFYDSVCDCTTDVEKVRVFDEHLGYIWKDSLITDCFYYQDTIDFQKGIAVVNCDQNVHCEQEVWCEFDHCGQGYIFRKFKIWQGCPDSFYLDHNVPDSLKHPVDTIYRHQRIWVGNECELDKYMFDIPEDQMVYSCSIEYDEAGNVIGDAGPENTGYATYKFDDDCRIVGIAHQDKVFKVVGGDVACYKIFRTWYFADWCGTGGEPVNGTWWHDYELVIDSCVQKIIVNDTMPPVCVITGPVEDGGSIEVGACAFDLSVSVDVTDPCGLRSYYWELKDVSDPDNIVVVDDDSGELTGDEADFDIESSDLAHGSYKLKVVTVDECNNEGYCEYLFDVISVKKPSPVCVTSLTATLTPWDSDQDGVVDSAHAVVWAGEFDSSSEPACQDTAIAFRIEFITGDSTDLSAAGDVDSLAVGCADAGSHLVRLWVVSLPSDTRDFCDVVLIVQTSPEACGSTIVGEREPLREISGMQDEAKEMDRSMLESDKGKQPGVGGRPLGQTQPLEGFVLEQNLPNPFQAETQIGFVLPEAMEATVTVYDITGRVIRSMQGDYMKGYNQVQFRKNDLGVSGVLYYRLNAGTFSATKKMILIE